MSSPQDPLKILVCGDVNGSFKELYQRVGAVNRKNGPFHMLLCVGNFFSTAAETNKQVPSEPPIPTFILGPTTAEQVENYPDSSGCEIGITGIIYLGK